MRDRSRGLTAAIILLAATIGLPVALAATIGNPLHDLPSLRAGQLSDTDVMAILGVVFYLAWVSFVIPVVIEIAVTVAAWSTRRPRRVIQLPLLGAQQHLARSLLSAALLLLPAAAATGLGHTPTPAAASALARQPAVSSVAPAANSRAAGSHHTGPHDRTYVIPEVGGMRSYWALADHYLGDGARWHEIWAINKGRVHADGTVMDSPRRLFSGWTILIPSAPHSERAAAPSDVTVRRGDTLSGIAAADGVKDWQQIWQANSNRREPGGQRFDDPNLIMPGWSITLPAPTNGAGHLAAPSTHSRRAHPDRPSARPSPKPGKRGTVEPQPTNPVPSSEPPARGDTSVSPAGSAAAAAAGDPATIQPTDHGDHRHVPVPLEVGLAAAAMIAALDRARRIAQRRRRIGHRPAPPPEPLRKIEAQLRRDARHAQPAVVAVQLAAALSATSPVAVRSVVARDDGAVDLHLNEPTMPPPPPFVTTDGGWRLPADSTGYSFAVDDVDDPYPVLIPIGRVRDGELLIDLAAAGPVSVAGDTATVTRLLAQLVAALVAAPWSGRVQLHVPTVLAAMVGSLDRVTVEEGPPILPAIRATTPPEHQGEEPGWCTRPVYLYCGWSADDQIGDLLDSATDPAAAVHAIIAGAATGTTVWTLDETQLTLPHLDRPVTVTLPPSNAPGVEDLLTFTSTAPDVPAEDTQLPDTALDAAPGVVLGTALDPLAVTDPGPRQINLLGPVELTGIRWLRRGQILNLLAYLALHRRGVDRHQLLGALWADDPPTLKTMRNRISEARALVDGAITDGPIWRLDQSVTTDWQQFTALGAGTPDQQRAALSLIRDRPFTGLDDCDWIDLEGIRTEFEAAIVDLAYTVAQRDFDTADYVNALAAAQSGLRASRYEERLHRLAIRAASAQGLTSVVKTLKQEMRTALDEDIEPDDTIQPETLALYADGARQVPRSDTSW